jgi:ABC-type antimicrobial peptide transport system permease subunit
MAVKTIVGVVGDAVYMSLREPVPPTMYLALAQWDLPIPLNASININVRSGSGPPVVLTSNVAAALTALEKSLTVRSQTLDLQVNDSFRQERTVALLSGLFAALALLLAAIGLYGATAYAVARRRTEIGIRIALGAVPASVVRFVISRVGALVGIGAVVGTAASLWLARLVAPLLYGVEPRDTATLVPALVVLGMIALAAALLPARRAARIDPAGGVARELSMCL